MTQQPVLSEPPPSKPTTDRPKSGMGRVLVIATAICMVMATIISVSILIPTYVMRQMAGDATKAVKELIQIEPRVTVNNVVVVQESKPIIEVALVTRDVLVEHKFIHTWMGSTKELHLRCPYRVKAGFKLTESGVDIRIKNHWFSRRVAIEADMPEPVILSVDAGRLEILKEDDGYWNKIKKEDRELALVEMRVKASNEARKAGIKDDVQRLVEEKIRQSIRGHPDFKFRYSTP